MSFAMTDPSRDPLSPEAFPPAIDWGAALGAHGRTLRLAILARVRDRHAADEVMQEVALAAVAQKAPIRDLARLGAWLRQLAVRQAMLYRRGRGRRNRLAERHARRISPSDLEKSADPLDWLVRDERSGLVRQALARLPARDTEVLLLKYLEGWDYRRLAEHLGTTESAIEARLHRARKRLRGELAAENRDEDEP